MNNLSDVIGGANLYGGSNYYFAPDRFDTPRSAIFFNQGFLQVPSGSYFSGDFTFTAWIFLVKYQVYSRIIDFGNGQAIDNICLQFYQTTSQMQVSVNQGSTVTYIRTSPIFSLKQWYFVAYVLSDKTGYVYVNGNQVGSGTILLPKKIVTTLNYIGKSNWVNDEYAEAVYDDIKIYSGALSSNDVINIYNTENTNFGMYIFFNQ